MDMYKRAKRMNRKKTSASRADRANKDRRSRALTLPIELDFAIIKHRSRPQATSAKPHAKSSKRLDEVDAEADLATIQRRSQVFCTSINMQATVRGNFDDYELYRRFGFSSALLPRANCRLKKKFQQPALPDWLKSPAELEAERRALAQATIVISNGNDYLGTDFHFRPESQHRGYLPDALGADRITYTGKGDLLRMPNEILEMVAGNLETISDLNRLSGTCRVLHFMIETWNLKDWLTSSMNDPLCGPFPHAVVASRARDIADWVIHGKNEIEPWVPRMTSRGCDMPEEARRELFNNSLTYGNFGIVELIALKIGVRLRDLRLFQLRKMELKPLFQFVIQSRDTEMLYNKAGLPRSQVEGICREIAVVNKYIYCELFHHDVDNLALKLRQQLPTLGASMRQDWLYYCVPDQRVPSPLPCQNMYQGIDRLMLMNFLGDQSMTYWNDEMSLAYESRSHVMREKGQAVVPVHQHYSQAAAKAIHTIATNTIDIAFPPVSGLDLYKAKQLDMDIVACKHEKIDRFIQHILTFRPHESRLWDRHLGHIKDLIDMGAFAGIEHDMWLSVQTE